MRLDSDGEEVYQCTQCNKDLCDQGERCGDTWCMDCVILESQRSAKDDFAGTISFMGRPAKTTTRPPKFFLKPEEYKKYGY